MKREFKTESNYDNRKKSRHTCLSKQSHDPWKTIIRNEMASLSVLCTISADEQKKPTYRKKTFRTLSSNNNRHFV